MTLASPPGHAIEWIVYPRRLSPLRDVDDATFVRAATWFEARSLGMAATGLGPDEIVVKDWPLDALAHSPLGAKREQLTAELKAATEKAASKISPKLAELLGLAPTKWKRMPKKVLGKGTPFAISVDR